MSVISGEVAHFFQNQGYVVVSTLGRKGHIHNSCKGIVEIKTSGEVYLLDLYRNHTLSNLKKNPHISLTAVDEHKFKGYCLQGKAKIVRMGDIPSGIMRSWEDRLASRISQRLIKNIRGERGHLRHPEALLPRPKYLIVAGIEKVVDLTPEHLKEGV
ncbi:MAG: pyridoxamine 5'-phosphate oxidase family protein [Candidatus Omnitrophota bacterium]